MSPSETIEQRVADLWAMLGRYRITLKDVCEQADLNYDSVRNNMRRFDVSHERMTKIEIAAIELRDKVIKRKGA